MQIIKEHGARDVQTFVNATGQQPILVMPKMVNVFVKRAILEITVQKVRLKFVELLNNFTDRVYCELKIMKIVFFKS